MKSQYIILGIESSCDETAAAVYSTQDGLLSNQIYSQIQLHQRFGGVVPEIASKAHLEKISQVVYDALDQAKQSLQDIDVFAVTTKPGLPGALLIGTCFAKGLAYATQKPIIGVNHLEGHAFSACIENKVQFPALCLTVSGGHTALYKLHDFGMYETLGNTLDDAAGEAFDKISKLIGLGYPGGPIIEQLAQSVGFEDFFMYPRGSVGGYDFSFSGLKTAVLYDLVKRGVYTLEKKQYHPMYEQFTAQVASSLLVCIKDIFIKKLEYALSQNPDVRSICFVGGVACNTYLRAQLTQFAVQKGIQLFYPSRALCTDNAGMIAFVGGYKALQQKFDTYEVGIL